METSLSFLDQLRSEEHGTAWRQLVELYGPLIRAWGVRFCLPEHDVDDLVQNVLMVVVRKVPRFDWRRRGSFRAWLRQITHHQLRAIARQWRHGAVGGTDWDQRLEQLSDPGSSLSQLWDREHDVATLQFLLRTVQTEVAPRQWLAFQLIAIEGQRPVAVAERLGMTPNAVMISKSRVLARLRQKGRVLLEEDSEWSWRRKEAKVGAPASEV